MLIFVPRTNLVYTCNFYKKVYALYANLFALYWCGGYSFTYQSKWDHLFINFLEDKYWREIVASFVIKIGERYDSIENTNDDPTLQFMESVSGFNNLINKFRKIMNSLANLSSEIITTKPDGRVAFRHIFSNDNYLNNSAYFYSLDQSRGKHY